MLSKIKNGSIKIAVIGLGYVGLPLAVEFGKHFDTVGFDTKLSRVTELCNHFDSTHETTSEDLISSKLLHITADADALNDRDVFIVTVPTPVDKYNRPDLTPLLAASKTVGKALKIGCIVVYESTVFPGCTEEECVPVIEKNSGLKFNKDFFCGYSPERINPGDKEHTLTKIRKITSGSTPATARIVDELYSCILNNGTHCVSSIKVAEAAKVIENSQRDLNIAFVNELAKICHLIGIDTNEVLQAAATKWNFMPFKPGLVGGHCIGVDPYYLTHKAQALGYLPEVILAGRRINDGMGKYIATEAVKLMIRHGHKILNSKVLQLGITFKENCNDIRNSHAARVTQTLLEFGCDVDVIDPHADASEVKKYYNLTSSDTLPCPNHQYSCIILTVAHNEFIDVTWQNYVCDCGVIFDVKGILPPEIVDMRL